MEDVGRTLRSANRPTGERTRSDGQEVPRQGGTRTASEAALPDQRPTQRPRPANVVADTVNLMMGEWYTQENRALEEQLEEATRFLNQERRRSQLLRTQLESSKRYSRMVAMWVPQVEEMFNGDLEAMEQIFSDQNEELEGNIRDEDPGETTEEEDYEEGEEEQEE